MRDILNRFAPALAASGAGLAAALAGAAAGWVAAFGGLGAVLAILWLREEEAPPSPPPASAAPQARGLGQGAGRALIERLPTGIVILDTAGRIAFVNARAGELFGRRVPLGRHASVIRVPALLDAIGEAAANGATVETDFSLSGARELDLHAHVVPLGEDLPGGRGRREAALGTLIAIEDHSRARQIEQLRRDFVANASHELKTPLASILGFIETLQGHARTDEAAQARFLGIMGQQAERMKRLVDDLLSLNRIELNEHVQPREPQKLLEIAAEAAAALQPVAAAREMRIEVAPGPAAIDVPGDRDELVQVFVNLVDNAVKYGEPGSAIRVGPAAEARAGMVGIEVADEGPGIAREHLPRLTERFYRVSAPRSREQGGTGLGLAIVKHILTRHRGHLEVESTPGEGSVFTVWLPRASGTREAADSAG